MLIGPDEDDRPVNPLALIGACFLGTAIWFSALPALRWLCTTVAPLIERLYR